MPSFSMSRNCCLAAASLSGGRGRALVKMGGPSITMWSSMPREGAVIWKSGVVSFGRLVSKVRNSGRLSTANVGIVGLRVAGASEDG